MQSPPPPAAGSAAGPLARRIRATREQRGQSQADLAGAEFAAGYIDALERGAV